MKETNQCPEGPIQTGWGRHLREGEGEDGKAAVEGRQGTAGVRTEVGSAWYVEGKASALPMYCFFHVLLPVLLQSPVVFAAEGGRLQLLLMFSEVLKQS